MSTFREAFRAAKNDGKSKFTWQGKSYSTQTAEEQGREVGAKAAAGSGRGMSAGRTAKDEDTAPRRAEIPKGTGGAKAPPASTERKMSPLEMGVLTTAGALGAPLAARGAMRVAPKVASMASKAGEVAKGAMSKAGEAAKGAASKVSEAAKGAMERRAAAKAAPERNEPSLYSEPPKMGGVFRSAREPAPPKPRVKVEGTKGGVYRSETPKATSEKPSFRSRTADRADERMDGYKKGGSVKGGGCETRSKKTRYI